MPVPCGFPLEVLHSQEVGELMTEMILLWIFAVIGLTVVLYGAGKVAWTGWNVLRNLNTTLREAVDVLKLYKADFTVLRQIQEGVIPISPNFGPEPAEPEQARQAPPIYPFPVRPWETFTTKPPEPDAEETNVNVYDVTPTDAEISDEEKIQRLADMGFGRPDPEFKPKAVEVDSE